MSMRTQGIIALDGVDLDGAWDIASRCKGLVWGVKGNTLLYMQKPGGISAVSWYRQHGILFFADAKLHDIPQTVANSVTELAKQGATLISAHASGGTEMLRAAVQAYEQNRPEQGRGILAISVLTSLTPLECSKIYGDPPEVVVPRFARFAVQAGCYGIVCSPLELPLLSRDEFKSLKKVTPGVRLKGADTHDQVRVNTPGNAVQGDADFLVIGRDVTKAPDPIAAVAAIDQDITAALLAA
jgi:orotidine-5'-phosphate decarboxylase